MRLHTPNMAFGRHISLLGAGITGLSFALVGVVALTKHFEGQKLALVYVQVNSVILTTLFTLGGVGLAVLSRGVGRDWWGYQEEWV
jgi:hypothetical protein